MIKVIAVDMDGTLLDVDHKINEITAVAVRKAQDAGIRFVIATGRNYKGARGAFAGHQIKCDYILASGAEVRNADGRILKQVLMDQSNFDEIVERIRKFPVAIRFCSGDSDYMLGTDEELKEYMRAELAFFHSIHGDSQQDSDKMVMDHLNRIKLIEEITDLRKNNIQVYKIFIFSYDVGLIADIDRALEGVANIASASSFINNLELTHIDAQKGIALKEYADQNGFSMDEVMAIGDSMNDYSMLSMDFGATIAMGNAVESIKEVAKYVTKTNAENGVAYEIEKILSSR